MTGAMLTLNPFYKVACSGDDSSSQWEVVKVCPANMRCPVPEGVMAGWLDCIPLQQLESTPKQSFSVATTEGSNSVESSTRSI